MLESIRKRNWKIGDTVFYHEPFGDTICDGVICGIIGSENPLVTIRGITVPGTTNRYVSQLFSTREEILAAVESSNKRKQEKYEGEIQDIGDLVLFAWRHAICGEDSDFVARQAYQNRTRALLGIDLERMSEPYM